MVHALTIDVEDWFDGIPVPAAVRSSAEPRLERGMETLLELLSRHHVRGTFFLLGTMARSYPRLVRRIQEQGHELGCHGWSHDLLYEMDREKFRRETRVALETIEDACGERVRAYRAAYFSITAESMWALEVLAELGFRYDSSIFPVSNWRYGIDGFNRHPQEIVTPAGRIVEWPMSVREVLGCSVPVSGGAYFRIYPYAITRSNIRSAERQGRSVVFYLHPWELDPDHPRVSFDWRARLTHYFNLRSTEPKLKRLLAEFEFAPLGEILDHEFA